MLGSISTGTDTDEENDKIVEEDDDDFCTYMSRGSRNKWEVQTRVLIPSWQECRSDWTSLKHHCTTAVPLKFC